MTSVTTYFVDHLYNVLLKFILNKMKLKIDLEVLKIWKTSRLSSFIIFKLYKALWSSFMLQILEYQAGKTGTYRLIERP